MKLSFLGGVGTVTGSKFLVDSGGTRVLIDCGLYQGVKQLRLRNWSAPPVDPASVEAIVLTHAHIDHSGYVPAFVNRGFSGPVHSTAATRDLCGVLLPDCGHIQEEDAAYAARKGFSRHSPPLPLYTEKDAEASIGRFAPHAFGEEFVIGALRLRFRRAGHILGAATVEVDDGRTKVLFSGDLGRPEDALMRAPEPPPAVDYVVMESTYGDRTHLEGDPIGELGAALAEALDDEKGIVLVPSFAVGRAQFLLFAIHRLRRAGRIPSVPVVVNSPMTTSVTDLYRAHCDDHRLSPVECAEVFGMARFVRTIEESKEMNRAKGPMILISASGMATGGRVLHHLKALLPDRRNTVLFPGFQAPGTRGHAMVNGAESVKIHGAEIPVRARVVQLDSLSAHADRTELIDWLGRAPDPPRRVYLVHGEPVASDVLRRRIQEVHHLPVVVPEFRDVVELD